MGDNGNEYIKGDRVTYEDDLGEITSVVNGFAENGDLKLQNGDLIPPSEVKDRE